MDQQYQVGGKADLHVMSVAKSSHHMICGVYHCFSDPCVKFMTQPIRLMHGDTGIWRIMGTSQDSIRSRGIYCRNIRSADQFGQTSRNSKEPVETVGKSTRGLSKLTRVGENSIEEMPELLR